MVVPGNVEDCGVSPYIYCDCFILYIDMGYIYIQTYVHCSN